MVTESEFELVFLRRRQDFRKKAFEFLVKIDAFYIFEHYCPQHIYLIYLLIRSFNELQQIYYVYNDCSSPCLKKPCVVGDKIFKFRPKCFSHLVAF